ncbi:peptidase [Microbacteriaceae bacterium VKM Ac-2855]|nr:peptidase [Microbacteriaceae bacterium VKM Ac-2855]
MTHGRRAAALEHGRRAAARPRRRMHARATIAVVAVLVLGGAVGASAVLRSQGSATANVRAGAVTVDWNASGVNEFSVPVTGLRPGDTSARLIDLRNTGTIAVSQLQLGVTSTTVAASSSDGLQLAIDRCSVAWTSATACSGTLTTVSADRPASGTIALPASAAFAVGGTDHLRATFRLPESAPTGNQNISGTVTVTVTAIQVPGRQR